MRVAIVGSRPKYERTGPQGWRFTDESLARQDAVRAFVEALPEGTIVVSGGADGVDAWAEGAASRRGLAVESLRPDYARYGSRAPLVRNTEIVRSADVVVAFWDGHSRGTLDSIQKARAMGKPTTVHHPDGRVETWQ